MKKISKIINRYEYLILFSAIILYIVIFSLISFWKLYNFEYNALDLAIINQVFYNSSLGDFFSSSIHPPSYLGDHFNPLLFLILPFYIILSNPAALLILQTIILAACAWPIYLISKNILNKNWAIFLAISWLLNPFVQNANLFEFHFVAFAILFIFFAFYFYQKQRFLPFLIFMILALLAREDVALVTAMFGLIALIDKRKIKWWFWPIVLSLGYFIFAMKITGLFSQAGQYKFLFYYSWLGGNLSEILKNILFHPCLLVPRIINPGNIIVLLVLFIPHLFISTFKPKYLLLSLLIYTQLILAAEWRWLAVILSTHYSLLLLPGIFIAAIFGFKKFLNLENKPRSALRKKGSEIILEHKPLFIIIILVSVIYSSLSLGPTPASFKKIITAGIILPETNIKREAIKKIPNNAAAAATYEFLTSLSSRRNIASLNYAILGKQQFMFQNYLLPAETEFLIIDYEDFLTHHIQYNFDSPYKKDYRNGLADWPKQLDNFGLIAIKNGIAMYQKNQDDKFEAVKILKDEPNITNQNYIEAGKDLKFLGHSKSKNNYELFWEVNFPLEDQYWLKLELTGQNGHKAERIYPFAYSLLYDNQEKGVKKIQTNYWLDFKSLISDESCQISISIIKIAGGKVVFAAGQSTKNQVDEILLGESIILEQANPQ